MKLIFYMLLLLPMLPAFGQSCPACSNPALQSNERIAAGLDSLSSGNLRLALNFARGFDFQGGHPNDKGLNQQGQVTNVPLHHHQVSLDFTRVELQAEYSFAPNWTLWLQLPFDFKHQVASVEFTEPVDEIQRAEILSNRDIHHRNESYMGLSDPGLLISRRFTRLIGFRDRLDVAIGTTIPIGKTEHNPLTAGENGEKHLHIQFGSGTLNPKLEFHYASRFSTKWFITLYTINKWALMENSLGYKAPNESTNGISLGYDLSRVFSVRGSVVNFYQSVATWDGKEDPNSGIMAYNANIGLSALLGKSVISGVYRFPIHQRALESQGDTFTFGPTILLSVSHRLNKL